MASWDAKSNYRNLFVSYAHDDRDAVSDIVELVKNSLSKNHCCVSVWYDEENLAGSQNWHEDISVEIERCDISLIFLSDNYNNNAGGYVFRELNLLVDRNNALGTQFVIIPVLLEKTSIPFSLRLFNAISVSSKTDVLRLASLIERVASGLCSAEDSEIIQIADKLRDRELYFADELTSEYVRMALSSWKPAREHNHINRMLHNLANAWQIPGESNLGIVSQLPVWRKIVRCNPSGGSFHAFCREVGWVRSGEVATYPGSFEFSAEAPIGHLPTFRLASEEGMPEMWLAWKRRFETTMELIEGNLR